jgi:chemotaxis signal transduction protein
LAVLDFFGVNRRYVLMLDHDGRQFGLLVDMVTRVVAIDGPLGPPPRGQERDCIAGVASSDGQLLFVVDIEALDERLGP